MKRKTDTLKGVCLDWAVALCEGEQVVFDGECLRYPATQFSDEREYSPSSNWELAGPIIEREGITTRKSGDVWYAMSKKDSGTCTCVQWAKSSAIDGKRYGPLSYEIMHRIIRFESESMLVAAMKCYVASKLDWDEIELPDDLTVG